MNRTVAFIQARVSSSRFPGKVLEDLGGLPLIVYMVHRARRAALVDEVVVVTSTESSDDPLAEALERHGIPVFRGPLDDVLQRFVLAAHAHDATEVVRLTGDCPLIDPAVVDGVLRLRRGQQTDYASNCEPPTFPDGIDVECFTRDALERAAAQARLASQREHVTLWMREEGSGLRRANLRALADLSALRLTVDYPDDLAVVRELVAILPADGRFDMYDVLRALAARSDLLEHNVHARNEGLAASLLKDKEITP